MVKADLTRDYYGDLELPPTADLNEIKKQFKKLALTYHPDRNPGRENEVVAKFQKIQSAHEVLSDAQERAKYDANRVRTTSRYQSGGNQRGNPWSNVGSQFPPPPKPPTARRQPPQPPPPPPPSAGAHRYNKFEAPKQSANQSAQEGAEARRSTYEAWENMRKNGNKPGPGSTWATPGPVPKGTPQSGREESNKYKHTAPPKARPGYEEFRNNYTPNTSPHRRAHSSGASNRKGFSVNDPGGDEPAAPRGAYSTSRNKPSEAPPPPPRAPVHSTHHDESIPVDPLRQFRETNLPYEPRLSTPYSTHGGEKLNPFEATNINRSKSTREPRDRAEGSEHMPRAGSDSKLNSPHRSQSYSQGGHRTSKPAYSQPAEETDGSSSDAGPEMKFSTTRPPFVHQHNFAKTRNFTQASPEKPVFETVPPQAWTQMPDSSNGQKTRKPSISAFQRWWKTNQNKEHPLNDFPPDGPSAGGQANPRTNGEPSMYDKSRTSFLYNQHNLYHQRTAFAEKRKASYEVKPPTVSESTSYNNSSTTNAHPKKEKRYTRDDLEAKFPHLFPDMNANPPTPPSGVSGPKLYPTEEAQRSVLDGLIQKKHQASGSSPLVNDSPASRNPTSPFVQQSVGQKNGHLPGVWTEYRESADTGSPSKKQKPLSGSNLSVDNSSPLFKEHWYPNANHYNHLNRFSFNVDDNTFQRTRSNGFSTSSENINTKFTPEEWEGKFEAGYFHPPEQKAANMGQQARARAQSGSRSRGRSPIKVRTNTAPIDPHYAGQPSDIPAESPGAKFSQDEWAGTFKPQTFMPPPPPPNKPPSRTGRKSRPSIIRPTMGTAAVVDDGSSSEEVPLFNNRPQPFTAPMPPSPDPMDVDTPPAAKPSPTIPKTPTENLKVNTSPSKRPAAPSASVSPTDQESLKVNFEDLKIADLLSSLDLPSPPSPPAVPETNNPEAYSQYLSDFGAYMKDWDLFNGRLMLHLVARKRQVDGMGDERWESERGLEAYRLGLKEDGVVLGHLISAQARHGEALKQYRVVKERIGGMGGGGGDARPRKKAH